MTSASGNAAEDRVHRFMIEYDAQHRIAAPVFAERDPDEPNKAFDLWRQLMSHTTADHFAASSTVELAQSFGRPPEYGPEAERIIGSEIHDGIGYVLTESTGPLTMFHEYTMRVQDGDWKIAAINQHFGNPAEPFVDRPTAERKAGECAPDAPFTVMPDEQARLDQTHNFTERRIQRDDDTDVTDTRLTRIGTFVTSSGVLSVGDFGYDNDDVGRLARTVTPGSYPIERIVGFGRNAAVRILFRDEPPVAWHPASTPAGGHVFGVDAGCIAIVDYIAYATMSRRAKAAVYDDFCAAPRPAALAIPLGVDSTGMENVGVAVDSGYGDGSYPAYWGVDGQGDITQLVIDFMVLVKQDDAGVLATL